MSFLSKILGDANERYLKEVAPLVEAINKLEKEFEGLADNALREKTEVFRKSLTEGKTLDDLLPEAFALVREAAKRTLGQRHFDVQLIGGIVLHQGKIAEMKTGEGKTLASTLAVYLNALAGAGVHVVTVNDYLARRDAVWMGQIYDLLGLSVGCLVHQTAHLYRLPISGKEGAPLDKKRDELGSFKVIEDYLEEAPRKEVYQADIVYGTNHEFGFDYLRDNMAKDKRDQAQRSFNFAIIDEIDSILIDEARTPLIISAPDTGASDLYKSFARIIPRLKKDEDYELDEEKNSVNLTDQGISRLEGILGIENIYTQGKIDYLHHLEQSLRADVLFKKDRDYVVKGGEIIIVDEFTGRLMPGRRWSGGLHQAVEAKEGVLINPESQTLATITLQNYFKLYPKLAGMTGTAATSAEEFDKVYNLDVISVPTNKPMIRKDLSDVIYKTEDAKFKAIVREIKQCHQKGQPVLVGTRSIEKNERLGSLLEREGVAFELLNAKHHEREAQIIAQAGKLKAVTVATNMAGRGVDIVLGGTPGDEKEAREVKELGGLYVIGTERHEARRIDNQLRGRAGRQGDPGSSRFFLSLEDDLLRIFGGDKISSLMETFNFPEEEPIEASLVSKTVEMAQTKIEGLHFDARKNLLDYDDVLNRHRDVFYQKRNEILESDPADLEKRFLNIYKEQDADEKDFLAKKEEIGQNFLGFAKLLYLTILDHYWMRHLEDMDWLKSSVHLQNYAQRDPLVEYKTQGYHYFQEMMFESRNDFISGLSRVKKQTASSLRESRQPRKEVFSSGKTPGRNDPCPCGSGKKYKKCHGRLS